MRTADDRARKRLLKWIKMGEEGWWGVERRRKNGEVAMWRAPFVAMVSN